jgi:uncharacterized protein
LNSPALSGPSKTVVIAGGSGFIGRSCQALFIQAGYRVVVLTRKLSPNAKTEEVIWDGKTVGDWAKSLEGATAVINLAGRPIATKFTPQAKAEILESRVDATKTIGDAIQSCLNKPFWLNASAIGFYGDRADALLEEKSAPGTGFLAETCQAWEDACLNHPAEAKRAVVRVGVVLGRGEGVLLPLVKLTRFFLGGAVGSGRQFLSWVHVQDLARMILWIIESEREGVYNGVAPNPATNGEFMATLRRFFGRPWSPPVPAFVLRLIGKTVGPEAELVLASQRVLPTRSVSEGFSFDYPDLEPAIKSILMY